MDADKPAAAVPEAASGATVEGTMDAAAAAAATEAKPADPAAAEDTAAQAATEAAATGEACILYSPTCPVICTPPIQLYILQLLCAWRLECIQGRQ